MMERMEHDAWFFIGVFVFIFLIWVATGGPTHPLSFTGPSLSLPGALGGGTYLSLPHAPFQVGSGDATPPPSPSPGGGGSGGGVSTQPPPLKGVAFGTPSNYRGKVVMTHYVSGAGSSNPNNEYIQISLSNNAPSSVSISGWLLKSEATGNAATILGGTEVPLSGVVNSVSPITLKPGEEAVVVSGRSPIGVSFRENKCIGYFSTFQKFSPSLPLRCPLPKTDLEAFYGPSYIQDAQCIDYVDTLPRCRVVTAVPPGSSATCTRFVTNLLNYNGCVSAHQSDTDFRGTTWRAYLGRTSPLWRTTHEVIKLLDNEGKTVDAFTY